MKKLSLYIFLVLMWCNASFAEELTINSLLKDGYKITKDETVKFSDITRVDKIITLTKGKSNYVICIVEIRRGRVGDTDCKMP